MQRQTVIALVIVVLILLGFGWWWYGRSAPEPPVVAAAPAPAPAPAPEAPVELPPLPALGDSDGFAIGLAADLGLGDLLQEGPGEWIKTFVRAVDMVAEGQQPKKPLSFLAPRGDYLVLDQGGHFYPDPVSYRRYDPAADAVVAVDARSAALAFDRAEPLADTAYEELGGQPQGFRKRLVEALDVLLGAPVPETPPELLDVAVDRFEYADPALESLMPVQKQMLRLGPDNQARVRQRLQEIRDLVAAGS